MNGVGDDGRPRVVLVHGIGSSRDVAAECQSWLAALARGLGRPVSADAVFVDYSRLFTEDEAQGPLDIEDTELLLELVSELVAELAEDAPAPVDPVTPRVHRDVRVQLTDAAEQGPGEVLRTLGNVVTTLLQLPGLRQAAQWASARSFLGHLAQVARYLRRDGLDSRIRARVHDAMGTGPAVVIAHSLGSVVAFEALHEHPEPVPLLVTLGSPLAMSTVVWQRLAPRPPRTPTCVARWINFWDRDDIVVARPRLASRILPNDRGVGPVSTRVRSTGLWTHTATKYLALPEVAAPVGEALRCAD